MLQMRFMHLLEAQKDEIHMEIGIVLAHEHAYVILAYSFEILNHYEKNHSFRIRWHSP